MRRNILPAVVKIRPWAAVSNGRTNSYSSALKISAASLSSVSGGRGGDDGNSNGTKREPAGINPTAINPAIKVIRVTTSPKSSKGFHPIAPRPLVTRSEVKLSKKIKLGSGRGDGVGSRLKSTSPVGKENTGPHGLVTVGFDFGTDEEAVSEFTRFSEEVGGCSAEGLLAGAEQAYYSTGVLMDLLASHTKSAITASSLREGEEEEEPAPSLLNSDEMSALVLRELAPDAGEDEKRRSNMPEKSTEALKTRNFISADPSEGKEKVLDAITAVLPISRPFAETIYNMWTLQNEGGANLFSITAPSDYVLDVKLLAFIDLRPTMTCSSTSLVSSANDEGVVEGSVSGSQNLAPQVEDHLGPSLVEPVRINHNTNSHLGQADDTSTTTPVLHVLDPQISHSKPNLAIHRKRSVIFRKGNHSLGYRIGKLFSFFSKRKGAVSGKDTVRKVNTHTMSGAEVETSQKGVTICVNGNTFSKIPSTALACVLLTLDAVVPPGRYTSDYDWYYKRISGHESESERIMVARAFSQNSPTLLVSFIDFLKRMFVGGQLQFVLNKRISQKLGIPDDASAYTPAMQKLMCMYMDSSKRWILSDLIPLAPTNCKFVKE